MAFFSINTVSEQHSGFKIQEGFIISREKLNQWLYERTLEALNKREQIKKTEDKFLSHFSSFLTVYLLFTCLFVA